MADYSPSDLTPFAATSLAAKQNIPILDTTPSFAPLYIVIPRNNYSRYGQEAENKPTFSAGALTMMKD